MNLVGTRSTLPSALRGQNRVTVLIYRHIPDVTTWAMYPRRSIAPMIRENCCQAPTRTAGESQESNVRNVVEDGTVRFLLLKYRFLIAVSPSKCVQSVEVSSAAQDFICFNAWLWRITHPRAFCHRDGSLRQPVGDRLAKDARDSPITALVARNKMA